MLATDLIKMAQATELKPLSIKDDKETILGYLNLGILEIYKRFPLLSKDAVITMATGVKTYVLDGLDVNVAIDLSTHQILTIQKAYDYDECELIINGNPGDYGISTPEHNVVKLADSVLKPLETLTIIYRAAPNFLTHERTSIPVPPQFLEALLHYIGYRAYAAVKSDGQSEHNVQFAKFEKSCNNIRMEGLYPVDALASSKFSDRGFV